MSNLAIQNPSRMKPSTISLPSRPAGQAGSRPVHCAPDGPQTAPRTKTIRVLVADDHPVVRQGIVSCLQRCGQIEIVGVVADGKEALLKARQLSPEVLLMDISMPYMTGLAVAEALHKELPKCKVLILSTPTSPEYVLRIIQSGAHG